MTRKTTQLFHAAITGNATELQHLMKSVDNVDSMILSAAAKNGCTECVKLLISVTDPNHDESLALREAVREGHIDCVKLLIPVSDPLHYAASLRLASIFAHTQCVDMLFELSNAQMVLDSLKVSYPDEPLKWDYLEHKISQRQRNTLVCAIEMVSDGKQQIRKM